MTQRFPATARVPWSGPVEAGLVVGATEETAGALKSIFGGAIELVGVPPLAESSGTLPNGAASANGANKQTPATPNMRWCLNMIFTLLSINVFFPLSSSAQKEKRL
jgi:hypothetical protein